MKMRIGAGFGATAGLFAAMFLSAIAPASAQIQGAERANFEQAEKFTGNYLNQFIYSRTLTPGWIGETDFFWYSYQKSDGWHYYLVNPDERVKLDLFDRDKMAAELSKSLNRPIDNTNLQLQNLSFTNDGTAIRFVVENYRFEYNLTSETLTNRGRVPEGQRGGRGERAGGQRGRRGRGGRGGGGQRGGRGGRGGQADDYRLFSPDRGAYVYAMRYNLYYVEGEDEEEAIQLTDFGEAGYGFGGGDNDRKARPGNLTWSRDSRSFYVSRADSSAVQQLYLIHHTNEPRPRLETYNYTMPGETEVSRREYYTFWRPTKTFRPLEDKWHQQSTQNIQWYDDNNKLRFIRRARSLRKMDFASLDLATGEISVIFSERYENALLETQNIRYINGDDDFIWWSERDGWGHYYLYDIEGNLKNQITKGAFRAQSVVTTDTLNNTMHFTAVGREPGENPYYTHLYRVNMDGTDLTLLDPGDANHSSRLSPTKRYVVDTFSRIDMAPKSVVRDATDGSIVMELEETDLSRLYEAGWKMPSTFKVKSPDGVTDIFGNIWLPFDFDPNKKYPIVLYVYPGPQQEGTSHTFNPTHRQQTIANLGFVAIEVGNRGGTPARSNAYHSYGYFNLRDYGLGDKKAAVEQLANRHSFIDPSRVGIYGHSGGGFMTAAALLVEPYNDFFTVGVSSAGNHDNNVYNQSWSERHHGLTVYRVRKTDTETTGTQQTQGARGARGARGGGQRGGRGGGAVQQQRGGRGGRGGGQQQQQEREREDDINEDFELVNDEYDVVYEIDVPANHELAANLKGHLLLVHGEVDNNVHPAGTIRLVNALIDAGKRFDFLILPEQRHGFTGSKSRYFERMKWEYFAEHLLGDYRENRVEMFDRDRE
jgi:dipeptidyl aminopeptidase/acylaminoacyl peptidase